MNEKFYSDKYEMGKVYNQQYQKTFCILKFTEEEITVKIYFNSPSLLENIQVTQEYISSCIKLLS